MATNDIIRKRKSIRTYDPATLGDDTLKKVQAQIEAVNPLDPDIRFSIRIVSSVRGMSAVKSPHYLIFGSEDKKGAYENIGFIGQQLDLFFSGSGLGSCWQGMAKSAERDESSLPHVIAMAFGTPAEPLHREISEFKRKPLASISEGADERLEAARLAPSAVNAQNWFFAAADGNIRCYRKKPNPLLGFMLNNMGCIDMGIALCHIAEESDSFHFIRETDAPARAGHVYMGTVMRN